MRARGWRGNQRVLSFVCSLSNIGSLECVPCKHQLHTNQGYNVLKLCTVLSADFCPWLFTRNCCHFFVLDPFPLRGQGAVVVPDGFCANWVRYSELIGSIVCMQTEIEESRSACDDGLTCAMLSLQQEVVPHLLRYIVVKT